MDIIYAWSAYNIIGGGDDMGWFRRNKKVTIGGHRAPNNKLVRYQNGKPYVTNGRKKKFL